MDKKFSRFLIACLVLVCLTGGILIGIIAANYISLPDGNSLSALQKLIDKHYNAAEYDSQTLYDAAAHAYIGALDDPYSTYYTAKEYTELQQSRAGKYTGVGISVSRQDDGKYLIIMVNKHGPAYKAGIKENDILLSFKGKEITGMDISEFNKLTVTKDNETVSLIVQRGEEKLTFNLVTEEIVTDMASYEMLDNKIAYIAVYSFNGNAAELVKQYVKDATSAGCKGFIIDIRDNLGGDLNVLLEIAGHFVGEKTVLYMAYKDGAKEYYKGVGTANDVPMTVLVNGNSASASEAFAGCIQSYKRGAIIGTKTYGKGVAQQTFPLDNGAAVKLTIAKYYLPNDICIHGVGITPDIVVELPEQVTNGTEELTRENDTQLQKAIQELTKLIK